MIELKNVSKIYSQNGTASLGIHNVSLTFNKGEIVAITGPSGCGKSTLLNVICGVDTFEEGEIYFNGEETSYFDTNDMDLFRRKYVSFIYQNYNIIDSYTVLENVMVPLLIDGLSEKEASQKAKELIKRVGLEKRMSHKGSKLSGGEKQRCVIARALANDAPILACDEPTGNLDSKTGDEIIKLLKEVATDKLVLIVTHNFDQVKDIITRNITLKDGEVVSDTLAISQDIKEDKPLELDYKDVKNKTLFNFSFKNIKNTPRKTILVSLVMIIFSFIILFLYSSSFSAANDASYNSYGSYSNYLVDRAIIFNNGNEIKNDLNLNGLDYYYNSFYEDTGFQCNIDRLLNVYPTNHLTNNYQKLHGRLPEADDEAFILFPNDSIRNIESSLDYTFDLYGKKLKLVGFAECSSKEKLKKNLLYVKGSLSYLNNMIIESTGSIMVDSYSIGLSRNKTLDSNTIKIITPKEINTADICLYLKDYYKYSLSGINIVVENGEYLSAEFNLDDKFIESTIYEISTYGNVDKAKAIASANNYKVIVPSQSGITISFSGFLFVILVALSSLAIIAAFFISYVILSRIYQSRNRDYSILRSLGLIKNQMATVVRFEVFLLMIVSSIISFIIFIILCLTVPNFSEYLNAMNVLFIIIYFVIIILFAYFISRRFNKRLFKFSVSKSIREVE